MQEPSAGKEAWSPGSQGSWEEGQKRPTGFGGGVWTVHKKQKGVMGDSSKGGPDQVCLPQGWVAYMGIQ